MQQASWALLHLQVDVTYSCATGVVAISDNSFFCDAQPSPPCSRAAGACVLRSAGARGCAPSFQDQQSRPCLLYSANRAHAPSLGGHPYLGQFDPMRGRRLGEAQNPGPTRQTDLRDYLPRPAAPFRPLSEPATESSFSSAASVASSGSENSSETLPLRVAVINPTALLHKDQEIISLQQDIVLVSETSAVEDAQRIVAHKLRPAGFSTVWSAPVAPHQTQREHQTTLRGHASGVALLSRFPARKSFVPLEPQVESSARLLESHVRIGHFEIRFFVVYGFPANYQDAGGRNAALLQEVLRRLLACPVPAIIGGDFNTDVTMLPEFAMFQQLGFVEAFQYWQTRTGCLLPPTCKQATRNDTLLLSGSLLPYVQGMRVADDLHYFDSHAPFMTELLLPVAPPCRQSWRKPTSWIPVLPTSVDLAPIYASYQDQVQAAIHSSRTVDQLDAAFQTWAAAVEATVDSAVQTAHAADPLNHPDKALPRAARGRCAYRPLRKRPLPRSAPAGRCGDYAPPCEAVSIVARAKVRQVRRLSTFVQGLTKAGPSNVIPGAVRAQLCQEWAAITRGRGYKPNFATWLLQCPHFPAYWSQLPPIEWARDVLQYVRFDADAHVRAEAEHRRKLAGFQVHIDCHTGCSRLGFRSLRPHPRPPFLCIPYEENQAAKLIRTVAPDTGLYFVPQPRFVRTGRAALLDDLPVTVEAVETTEEDGLLLKIACSPAEPPKTARFVQDSAACTAAELNRAFIEFWAPIWCRDTGSARTDPAYWSTFLQSLPPAPLPAQDLTIDMLDVGLWKKQIRRLKNGRATGYCGFSPTELKTLPDAAVSHLAQLFACCKDCGFPNHLAQATVHVLAKVDAPQNIGQGRPITVCATIYRLWSSVAARAILQQWATWLPESVRGCVPGRGARDISLVIQVLVEEALQSGRPLGGFSLDIVKCFNQLPRLPLRQLLLHLHVPLDVVEIWFQFLECNKRFALFHGELGSPVASTTGAPEGDPLSVVGQIAVCWALVTSTHREETLPWVYVDNLSWLAAEAQLLGDMLRRAADFCHSLLLPVDWKKSFAWGTTPALRAFWARHPLPGGSETSRLQLVTEAKDLGVAFRFNRVGGLGKAAARLSDGLLRLKRLQRQHRPLQNAAHLVQTGVWPAAFYGLEGHHVPEAKVDQLRSAAARAICGDNHSMSPHLAIVCITDQVLDPAVYLLVQALCALRRLLRTIPDYGSRWLQATCAAFSSSGRAHGPAGALAKQLHAQGWVLRPSGQLKGVGHWHINLFASTPKQIRVACQSAWNETLGDRIGHRNGLFQADCPCPRIMRRVLAKFPQGAQLHLARNVVGGYMSRAARATFDPLVEKACPHCGDVDTKAHRLLLCPAMLEVRQPFRALLEWISESAPHWLHAPYPVPHPEEGFLRLLWNSRQLPPLPKVDRLLDQQPSREHHVFTDGSCVHPASPAARHAAWSAVLHNECFPVPDWSLVCVQPELLRAAFPVVAQGLLPGEQSIYRAEVAALVQVVRLAAQQTSRTFHVWVDSSSAQQTVQQWLDSSEDAPAILSTAGDLLEYLPRQRPTNVHLHKVKAHQNLDLIAPAETHSSSWEPRR